MNCYTNWDRVVFSMVGCISEAPGIYQLFIAEIPDSNVQFGYVGENQHLLIYLHN